MSKSENRRRTAIIPRIRCFPEERNQIEEKAKDCGLSMGQYLIQCGLGRQTRSNVDSMVINELRKLGGLQKHLFIEGQGGLSAQYSDILEEIKQAISRVGRS
ncbi:plasmid mobilization protein MobA [Acinetobacter junii]|nr:plasmid mobilization protein MobA [Acinetobacter junii]ENV52055.1 hypothetical protein F953_00545 [Acinetobacter junii CIP 107470 = MTCC 11364]